MANRHRRARGGRNLGPNYSAPGSTRIQKEAESQEEKFAKGGTALGRAHGGRAKARADRGFRAGGTVWSTAATSIRGKKGFASHSTPYPEDGHNELVKSRAGDTEVKADAKHRMGHKGKAKHQYADGGHVTKFKDTKANLSPEDDKRPDRDWKRGGRARKDGGKCDEMEDD